MKLLVFASLAFGLAMIATASMPTFFSALALIAVTGAFSILFLSTANSLLQLSAKPELRGRVMALYTVAFLGTTPFGAPLVGVIAQAYGGRAALAVGGLATLGAGLLGAAFILRKRYLDNARGPAASHVALG